MREIKFRAWDEKIKKMFYSGYGVGTFITNSRWWVIEQNDVNVASSTRENILMQYTGLKDKNGTEIYEGDIIKCTDGTDEINELNSDTGIGKVEWLTKWGFWNISNIENGLGDILHNGYVEVIGNIFEHKYLLD